MSEDEKFFKIYDKMITRGPNFHICVLPVLTSCVFTSCSSLAVNKSLPLCGLLVRSLQCQPIDPTSTDFPSLYRQNHPNTKLDLVFGIRRQKLKGNTTGTDAHPQWPRRARPKKKTIRNKKKHNHCGSRPTN